MAAPRGTSRYAAAGPPGNGRVRFGWAEGFVPRTRFAGCLLRATAPRVDGQPGELGELGLVEAAEYYYAVRLKRRNKIWRFSHPSRESRNT